MIRSFVLCLFIQIAAVLVSLAVFNVGTNNAWIAAGIYGLVSSFIFAFWIKLLSDMRIKDISAAERERFLAEREKLKVQAEQEKLNLLRETHKQVSKEATKASARANFKIGLVASAAVIGGIVLIATHMFYLGILTLTTAGGGLAGYLMRMRQEKRDLQKQLAKNIVSADELELEETLEDEIPTLALPSKS